MKRILALPLMMLAAAAVTARPGADVIRTVYFSAVDSKGVHVTDLTAADLTVKEGGKERVIEAVRPATALMQVSILVDDVGTAGFQAPVSQLFQAAFGKAEFAVRVLNPQAIKVMDFTRNADDLRNVLGRLGRRGNVPVDSEQIIAGVLDAAKELHERKARRPSIIAMTISGERPASDTADEALNALKDSGASLSVIYLTTSELGRVLGDGPKQSGGIIERVSGHLVVGPAIAKIADHLLNQCVLTYTIPDGVKLNERFALSTSRKGVKLIAPTKIPDK